MKIRDSVRQRRNDRIRQLSEEIRLRNKSMPIPGEERQERSDSSIRGGLLEDPEYVWKMERGRTGGSRSSGGFVNAGSFTGGSFKYWRIKLVSSILLFAVIWGIFYMQPSWSDGARTYIARALQEDLDYASIAAWYESLFKGSPSFIPSFREKPEESRKVDGSTQQFFVPIHGKWVQPFSAQTQGVEIAAGTSTEVRAMEAGLVVFAGQTNQGEYMVKLQHAHQMSTIYGKLKTLEVKENDWVKGGETIGFLPDKEGETQSVLYFAVLKNGVYMNPADVIPVD